MAATTPVLTDADRAAALKRAAEVRRARAQLRADLKAGRTTPLQVLDRAGDDSAVARMRVRALLTALPAIGDARARKIMADADIAPTRRIQGLGPRQSESLRKMLEENVPPV